MSAPAKLRRWVFVSTAGLLLAACSSSTPDVPLPFAVYTPIDGDPPNAWISGALVLSDGCLTVNGFPLSLPDSAEWDADANVLSVDGNVYETGERVTWRGSYGGPAPDDLPASCPPSELARVFYFD